MFRLLFASGVLFQKNRNLCFPHWTLNPDRPKVAKLLSVQIKQHLSTHPARTLRLWVRPLGIGIVYIWMTLRLNKPCFRFSIGKKYEKCLLIFQRCRFWNTQFLKATGSICFVKASVLSKTVYVNMCFVCLLKWLLVCPVNRCAVECLVEISFLSCEKNLFSSLIFPFFSISVR